MRFMRVLFYICLGASFGTVFGVVWGCIRQLRRRKRLSGAQLEAYQKFRIAVSRFLTAGTFLFLALGLIWCVYFLLLGLFFPAQADYANNMSELVVAVLTVISILFAFVEFLRRKGD